MTGPTYCRTQLNDKGNNFSFHDPATDVKDCNVAMTSECLEIVTGTQLTARECRHVSGELVGPTGKHLANKVFKSQGMVNGQDYVIFTKAPVQTVRDLLKSGWFVVGFISYGVINDELNGEFSSDRGFRGAHAVAMAGFWQQGNKRTNFYDPLADGRHPNTPLGRQNAPFALLRDAMAGYAGVGVCSGYAVRQP